MGIAEKIMLIRHNLSDFFPFQGGMALRSSEGLPGHVAFYGGIGVVAITLMSRVKIIRTLREVKEQARGNGLIAINIMAADALMRKRIIWALRTKLVDIVIQGAGISKSAPLICLKYNVPFIPIISRPEQVPFYLKHFGEAIVAFLFEGAEAGGHIGNLQKSLFKQNDDTLEKIVKQAGKVPVIAAGGITPKKVSSILSRGAKNIQIATPFILTKECALPKQVKDLYVKAKENDLVIIESPAGLPGRAIRNFLTEEVANNRCFPPKSYKLKCAACLKSCKCRESEFTKSFCIRGALIAARRGNLKLGLFFSGGEIANWNEITTVKKVMVKYKKELNKFRKTHPASL